MNYPNSELSNNQLSIDERFIEEFNKLFCLINNLEDSNINQNNKELLYLFMEKWKNIWQANFENMINKNLSH